MARRPTDGGPPPNHRPIKTTMRMLRVRRSRRNGNAGLRQLVQEMALDALPLPARGRKQKTG